MTETAAIRTANGLAAESDVLARMRDFSSALQRGDAQAALEAARDICLANPNSAEAHYAFGQAWVAAGKPARAEQAFAVATKLRPDFADYVRNLDAVAPAAPLPEKKTSGKKATAPRKSK